MFQEVLHPASEEEFFRNCDKEKREEPCKRDVSRRGNVGVEVEKPKCQPQRDGDRGIEQKLTPANPQIRQTKSKVESHSLQPANRDEAVDAGIQQQHLVEHSKPRRPCRLKPAQIYRKTQNREHKKITPIPTLLRIGNMSQMKQPANRDRQQQIERKPTPSKLPVRDRNDHVRHTQHSRSRNANGDRQT